MTQPLFKKPPFDTEADGNKYSVPYMFGTTGFCARLDEVVTRANPADALGQGVQGRHRYAQRVKEGLGAALLLLGDRPNSTSQTELDEATAKLIEQSRWSPSTTHQAERRDHQRRALQHCWDGDAIAAIATLGLSKVRTYCPPRGTSRRPTAVCIPKNAPSPYAAHLFLDFLLDPQIAAENANYLAYQPVVEAADPLITDLVQRAMRPTPR